jgi:PAS domain S-box-containing protein
LCCRATSATQPGADPSFSFEHRTLSADGTVRWLLAQGRVFFDGDRAVRVAGTALDITDRKRAEEKQRLAEEALRESEAYFRQLAEALPQIVWIMRPDGRATYYNRRFAEYHGYQAGEDISDRSSNIHPDDKAATWAARDAAVAEGRPINADVRIRRHDGAYRWHRMSAVPLKRATGEVYAYVGTATDVDDMRRAEERQRLLINELNHRVKNTLSTVQAIAAQSFGGRPWIRPHARPSKRACSRSRRSTIPSPGRTGRAPISSRSCSTRSPPTGESASASSSTGRI